MPTIINSLGFTRANGQLLTVPIYIFASIICVIQAYASDRAVKRFPFIFFSYGLVLIGFIIAIAVNGNVWATYVAVFILTAGIYPAFPGVIAWLANNLAGQSKRGIGMAFQIALGNMAGAMSSNFYRSQDSPGYRLGHALEIMFIGLGLIAVFVMLIGLRRINKKRELLSGEEIRSKYSLQELADLGDRSPSFRYTL